MLRKIFPLQIFILTMLLLTKPSHAFFIIDTGSPPDNTSGLSLRNGTDSPNITPGYRWLAGQFTLNDDYNITSLEAHLQNRDGSYKPATKDIVSYVVYGDSQNSPDTSKEYFRKDIFVPITSKGLVSGDWVGSQGLNLNLTAGNYWFALEVLNEYDFIGHVSAGAPNPLDLYALKTNLGGAYSTFDSSLGFRVGAASNAVPEPATFALFGVSLLGTFVRRKFAR